MRRILNVSPRLVREIHLLKGAVSMINSVRTFGHDERGNITSYFSTYRWAVCQRKQPEILCHTE